MRSGSFPSTPEAETALPPGCEARCPGCAHRSLAAGESSRRKEDWLRARLSPWAQALEPLRAPGEAERWGYREKTCLRAQWAPGSGRWILGFRRARELDVIGIPGCPVHSVRLRGML